MKIQDNVIERCRFAVFRNVGAPLPEINGTISRCSNDEAGMDLESCRISIDIDHGRKCFENREKVRKDLHQLSHLNLVDVVLMSGIDGSGGFGLGCKYCTKLPYGSGGTDAKNVVFCEVCDLYNYCSMECLEKDKEYHKKLCEWNVRVMALYALCASKSSTKRRKNRRKRK